MLFRSVSQSRYTAVDQSNDIDCLYRFLADFEIASLADEQETVHPSHPNNFDRAESLTEQSSVFFQDSFELSEEPLQSRPTTRAIQAQGLFATKTTGSKRAREDEHSDNLLRKLFAQIP